MGIIEQHLDRSARDTLYTSELVVTYLATWSSCFPIYSLPFPNLFQSYDNNANPDTDHQETDALICVDLFQSEEAEFVNGEQVCRLVATFRSDEINESEQFKVRLSGAGYKETVIQYGAFWWNNGDLVALQNQEDGYVRRVPITNISYTRRVPLNTDLSYYANNTGKINSVPFYLNLLGKSSYRNLNSLNADIGGVLVLPAYTVMYDTFEISTVYDKTNGGWCLELGLSFKMLKENWNLSFRNAIPATDSSGNKFYWQTQDPNQPFYWGGYNDEELTKDPIIYPAFYPTPQIYPPPADGSLVLMGQAKVDLEPNILEGVYMVTNPRYGLIDWVNGINKGIPSFGIGAFDYKVFQANPLVPIDTSNPNTYLTTYDFMDLNPIVGINDIP